MKHKTIKIITIVTVGTSAFLPMVLNLIVLIQNRDYYQTNYQI